MSITRYILCGVVIGLISVVYNYLVFNVFHFYPDVSHLIDFFWFDNVNLYLLIFLKNFLVGLILMVLFYFAYSNIRSDKLAGNHLAKGIFFFVLYAVFALFSFSIGDMLLIQSQEGVLILLTLDGFVETLIATIPIKLFHG